MKNILLNGPSRLTETDKEEVFLNVKKILTEGSNLHLFVKGSFETEILRYVLEYMKNVDTQAAYRLFLYTMHPMDELPIKRKVPIEFLTENGANYHSFNHSFQAEKVNVIERKTLTSYWEHIINEVDMVIVFFDGEQFEQLIPLDVANDLKVEWAKSKLIRKNLNGHSGSLKERTEFSRFSAQN